MSTYRYKKDKIGCEGVGTISLGSKDISNYGSTITEAIVNLNNTTFTVVRVTQVQYNALSNDQKNANIIYEITDMDVNDTIYNTPLGETATTAYAGNSGKALNDDIYTLEHQTVTDISGFAGLRFYNGELSYDDNGVWREIRTKSGSPILLQGVTNLSAINNDNEVLLRWTDPENVIVHGGTFAAWESTTVIRKEESAPTDETDGEVVAVVTEKNKYSINALSDTNVENGKTYYYGVFPKSTDGNYTYSSTVGANVSAIYPSAATGISVSANKTTMVATVTYTLPNDAIRVKIVMKAGSEPESSSDGTVVIDSDGSADFSGLSKDVTYYFTVYTCNEKGRETKSGTVNCLVKSLEIVTWAAGTDAQIAAMIEAHYAGDIDIADYWSVGQTRTVNIASFSSGTCTHVAQNIQLVIIGIKHDDLSSAINGKTKAAITIQTKQLLGNAGNAEREYYWGSSHYPVSNSENWSGSPLRTTYLNTNFYNALSTTTFRSLIKTVTKKNLSTHTGTTTINTSDKIFLPSYPEVFGTTTYSNYISGGAVSNYEGSQYNYFSTSSNRIKYWNNNGANSSTAFYWWLRSPSSGYISSYGYCWCFVDSDGTANASSGSFTCGLAPCFTI